MTFHSRDIQKVSRVRQDKLRNGMHLGFAVGVAAGSLWVRSHCSQSSERSDCHLAGALLVVPLAGVGGLSVGGLLDSAIPALVQVYPTP